MPDQYAPKKVLKGAYTQKDKKENCLYVNYRNGFNLKCKKIFCTWHILTYNLYLLHILKLRGKYIDVFNVGLN